MLFQLLHGVHVEHETTHKADFKRDENGMVVYVSQPIVESKTDLVARFGPEKFRRLSKDEEATILLQADKTKLSGETNRSVTPPDKSAELDFEKAVREGAKEIAEPPGKDVTENYSEAKKAGLKIFRKGKDSYMVQEAKTGELLTAAGSITKKELVTLIDQYSE